MDAQLAAALTDAKRLLVEELRGGVRVEPTSWVGVVRFEHFDVEVVPKYAGYNLGLLRMLDYTTGLDALKRAPAVRDLAMDGTSLLDLIGMLLCEEASRLLRDGLLDDYVTREESLTTLRGRLMVREQVIRRFGQLDRLECRFDELEGDIPENRLVGAGLLAVRRYCGHPLVRERAGRLHSIFVEVCQTTDDSLVPADSIAYHHRNRHYAAGHGYARLLLRQLGVRDLYAPGDGRSFAFMIDMNRLFENFVTQLVTEALARRGVHVGVQRRDRSIVIDESTERAYSAVIPDMLLEPHGSPAQRRLPVDAKYKLYETRGLDPTDIYQLFFYAFAFDSPDDREDGGPARCFILFPSLDGSARIGLRIQTALGARNGKVTALGVSVAEALAAIDVGLESELPFVVELAASVMVSPPGTALP